MTPSQFITKWTARDFGERQAAQTWFLDLLRLVGHPDPIEFNDRDNFTFEKPVPGGFADAYLAGHFGWEFKGRDADLPDAFNQLLRYQVYLRTPPLLIVSSFQMIRIQTNFPGKETVVHEIPISKLDQPEQLRKLRNVFFDPAAFEPERTVEQVTRETTQIFGNIVRIMENSDVDSNRLARFLNQIVFCLYVEDTDEIGLLPRGLFTDIAKQHFKNPAIFDQVVRGLFANMRDGGFFGQNPIPRFNGDLFNELDTVELSEVALYELMEAADKNWRNIEPSIFGTMFEGALDAAKRAQLGAHYTGADDIMLVVEPVVMEPLRREWDDARNRADILNDDGKPEEARAALDDFLKRLTEVTVLDPACGSGNFLYITLRSLLDLEKEVIDHAARLELGNLTPTVNPRQMYGLEIDPYAAQIARTALWIGYIQWHQFNGFAYRYDPILSSLDTIRQTDAILDLSDPDNPKEPDWPAAEFIIGNPPFLGSQLIRGQLKDPYTEPLFQLYGGRIPSYSDYCCYWFEKSRQMVVDGKAKRVGLLATQGIRGGASRRVLERVKDSGDIFLAYSDREWVLDGAAVHVSIVCFDDGAQTERELDGESVPNINANLMAGADLTTAQRLQENAGISFIGDMKKGKFEITAEIASEMLSETGNPNGCPNSDVVRPWINALDITRRARNMWIIDFDMNMTEYEAAQYESPFEYIKEHVKPFREKVRNQLERRRWWVHGRTAPDLRRAVKCLDRYIATPRVSKHRLFVFMSSKVLPDGAIVVIARDDDYTFGVLHSRIHELWALTMGTQLETRPRYSHTATFETFPFPHPTSEQRDAIATAAHELDQLRENWRAADPKRTLTDLYNSNPTWLQNAHANLNNAVADAYGWPADLPNHQILESLLALNLRRHAQE